MYIICDPDKGLIVDGKGGFTEIVSKALVFHNSDNAEAYLRRLLNSSYSRYSSFCVIALQFPVGLMSFSNWGD